MFKAKGICAVGFGLGLYVATMGAALAQQQPAGWYFGGFAGQSTADVNKEELDDIVSFVFSEIGADVVAGSSTLDDSDTTWSVFGGYRFTPNIAVEFGYQDLGTAAYKASGLISVPEGMFPATMNLDFSASGFTLAGVATAPLGEFFDVHARLGVFFADSKAKVAVGIDGFNESETISGSSQDLYYGIGAAFHFGGQWSVSLDYQMFKDVGDDEKTFEVDIDAVTLSLIYRL